MLERIKTLLGINVDEQADAIEITIENTKNPLEGMLGKSVPSELEYIIEEITVRRFNRIGSEGMRSESVEGHTVEFYDLEDEFKPYLTIIEQYKDDPEPPGRGKVMFI